MSYNYGSTIFESSVGVLHDDGLITGFVVICADV